MTVPALMTIVLAALVVAGIAAFVLFHLLGFAGRRHEVDVGLAQLAELSFSELQGVVEQGLRGRGLGALREERDDGSAAGSPDVLLSDGTALQLLRLKHGAGLLVDAAGILDLANRRDARRATAAIFATTGALSRDALAAAEQAGVQVVHGPALWDLVQHQLPPRLRERIANRRGTELRKRSTLLALGSLLAGSVGALVAVQLTGAPAVQPAAAVSAPVSESAPVAAPAPVTPSAAPAPAAPQPPAEPLDEATLTARRAEAVGQVRLFGPVYSASWSTASTLIVVLRPDADLDDDSTFDRVCEVLRPTEELRTSRVQLELLGADPTKTRAARWRQCQ